MPVLYKRVITPHREFITRTRCMYYNPAAAKGKRGVRMCKTGESKKKINNHNSYLKKKYELYNNFNVGDLWVTLTHRNDIEAEAAHKVMTNVIGQVRKDLKKKEIPFLYYAKTEAGEKVKPHHHMLIKNTSPEIAGLILKYWSKYGQIKEIKSIYNIENGKLVTYFLDGGDHKELNFEKYAHSRNLVQPKIEKRIYPSKSFRENPKPPKAEDGYRYEICNLFNGFPGSDGFVYQEYELRKVREEDESEKLRC